MPPPRRSSSMWLFGGSPSNFPPSVGRPLAPRYGRPQRCSARLPRGARWCYPELPAVCRSDFVVRGSWLGQSKRAGCVRERIRTRPRASVAANSASNSCCACQRANKGSFGPIEIPSSFWSCCRNFSAAGVIRPKHPCGNKNRAEPLLSGADSSDSRPAIQSRF
jgi:hypothetical protein